MTNASLKCYLPRIFSDHSLINVKIYAKPKVSSNIPFHRRNFQYAKARNSSKIEHPKWPLSSLKIFFPAWNALFYTKCINRTRKFRLASRQNVLRSQLPVTIQECSWSVQVSSSKFKEPL